MIQPTGTAIVQEALRELKLSQEQDCQINREQANNYFDQKISELRNQVDLLKDEAKKMKGMGIFNFVMGLVTTFISLASGILGSIKEKAYTAAINILGVVKSALESFQKLINDMSQKDSKKSEAKQKESEILAETFEKFYTDYHAQEQEAKQKAHETLQTMKEINKENAAAYESMAQIGK